MLLSCGVKLSVCQLITGNQEPLAFKDQDFHSELSNSVALSLCMVALKAHDNTHQKITFEKSQHRNDSIMLDSTPGQCQTISRATTKTPNGHG